MGTMIRLQEQDPEVPTVPPDVPHPNPQKLPGQNPTPDRNDPIVDDDDIERRRVRMEDSVILPIAGGLA